MNKSNCCGAEVNSITVGMNKYYICSQCVNACDLAPALRDSKEVLEFVEKLRKQKTGQADYLFGELSGFFNACTLIKNFIEGK